VKGTRIYPEAGDLPSDVSAKLPLGGYAYMPEYRSWIMRSPNGDLGSNGGECHTITEHQDGSITVSPSLVFTTGKKWHGWLEAGVWREC